MNQVFRAIVFCSVLILSVATQAARPLSAQDLFKRYQPAVVKVVIRQQKIQIGTGTGFFISADGQLVTNYHVLKNALRTGSFSAEFVLANGKVIRDYQVSHCRDDRQIDLCVLKLATKAQAYFKVSDYDANPGETAYVIGHPQGLDFSITNGIVSAVRTGSQRIREVQITAAISPGNSGGPIFNSQGTLLAVASKFLKDGQNLNFGIHTKEVAQFLRAKQPFMPVTAYRKAIDIKVADAVKHLVSEQIDPAYAKAEQMQPIHTVQGFKEVLFDFGDAKLRFPVPAVFEDCEKMVTKKGGIAFQCASATGSATFSVSRILAGANAPLHELDGKKAVKEKPLPVVEMLMQDGTWGLHEQTLNAENKKYLFSVPSETKCRRVSGQSIAHAFFADDSVQCRFSIYNDMEPDAFSYSIWAQRGKYIYDFYVWMEDAALADYFNHVPSLAVLGARLGDPPPEVKKPFSIEAHSYQLMSTDQLSDGTLTFLYSRSRGPASNTSPMYMINVLKSTFAKKDLIKRSRQLFEGTLDGFNKELQKRSLRFQQITADNMPGFLQTGVAHKRNQDLAVFHATLLDDDHTFMIYGYGDSKESNQLLEDFLRMTLSLKRQK